ARQHPHDHVVGVSGHAADTVLFKGKLEKSSQNEQRESQQKTHADAAKKRRELGNSIHRPFQDHRMNAASTPTTETRAMLYGLIKIRAVWFLAMLALYLTAAVPQENAKAEAKARPTYEVYALRYATIPDFPVAALVKGAESTRK